MTKEQEQLVTDNHNLIYWFIQKKNLDLELYYDVLAIGLCKAAIHYDESKNLKFATYAVIVMDNEYKAECRRNMSQRRRCDTLCSLDEPIHNEQGDIFSRSELITNGLTAYDEIIPYDLEDVLNDRQLQIARLCMLGFTQDEISKQLNYSQSYISRLLAQIKKKLEVG